MNMIIDYNYDYDPTYNYDYYNYDYDNIIMMIITPDLDMYIML